MIQIRPKRFPPGPVKKLTAHSADPFKNLKKINLNAYVIDLPPDFGLVQYLIYIRLCSL